ncbi:MAG: DUF3078 domain-containing protein [Sphingobacteriaceae bacterium]
MLKLVLKLTVFSSFLLAAGAFAQDADTAHVDTILLNKFRIEPKKNFLPVPRKQLEIIPVQIPVTLLDYEVNYWRKYVLFGINVNQSAFSNNWSGGGVSSIALGTNFNFKTEYKKNALNFSSEIDMKYGKSKNKGQIARKTNDRIFWDNKIALQMSKKWYFFGSLSFESQFDEGFIYPDAKGNPPSPVLISQFMSPGYTTESIGFEFKQDNYFSLRMGTGTARQTFVLDTSIHRKNPKNFGVPVGKRINNDLAFQIVANFNKDVAKNINLTSRYQMFIPYNDLKKIDYRLDATLSAKVNRLINVSLSGTMLYNKDVDTEIQASQGLALGMVYRFPN